MKLRIISILAVMFLCVAFIGCNGLQIKDSSTHKILAYAAGKSMAIGIMKIRPEVDKSLTTAWVEMMERNEGNEQVESSEMVSFYNECLMIIAGQDFDKYGLINDLSMLLTIFGSEINPDNNMMVFIQPVPMEILHYFEMGYANGRQVAN